MTAEKTPKTILLVDDEKDIAELTRMRIISLGYNVILAGDGEEALVKIKSEHPDLILYEGWFDKKFMKVQVEEEKPK